MQIYIVKSQTDNQCSKLSMHLSTSHPMHSIKIIEPDETMTGPAWVLCDYTRSIGQFKLPEQPDANGPTCFVDYELNSPVGKKKFITLKEQNAESEYSAISVGKLGTLSADHHDGLAPIGLYFIAGGLKLSMQQLLQSESWSIILSPNYPEHQQLTPALFLDRDGVINEDTEYLIDPKDLRLRPGIEELIAYCNQKKWPVICLTNQSGVARGKFSEEQVHSLHLEIDHRLRELGAKIDLYQLSPFHFRKGIGDYRKYSVLRKPYPGMLLLACRQFAINLDHSWMIGDKDSDILHFSPVKTFLLPGAYPLSNQLGQVINNFREVLNFIRI